MNVKTLDYRSLAKNFQGHKSGKQIAIVMLKNAKKKGALHGSHQ